MSHRLAICSVIVCLALSQPASAASGDVTAYDTVDAIEVQGREIIVTGIVAGQAGPSTATYPILGASGATEAAAARCDRLALLAASKPGKFQFAVVQFGTNNPLFSCRLIVRTP